MTHDTADIELQPVIKPGRMLLVVLILFMGIAGFTKWYSNQVSMPRYCGQESETIEYLRKVIEQPTPAGNEPRRPYLIAAKLIYLVPRKSAESTDDYLIRVQLEILKQCI